MPQMKSVMVRGVRSYPDFDRRTAGILRPEPGPQAGRYRYADDLGDVVAGTPQDTVSARQLARDLSGYYAAYRIEFETELGSVKGHADRQDLSTVTPRSG